jgi:biotin synthase
MARDNMQQTKTQYMTTIAEILDQTTFSKADIVRLLTVQDADRQALFAKAEATKIAHVGKKVFYRGLIEFSNVCIKDCLYCGIRKSNPNPTRYTIAEDEILEAARFAYNNKYASLVLQAGERTDEKFVATIEDLVRKIKELSDNSLGITLSLGEQSRETYERWRVAGAHRYLLRIETSNRELYYKIHPENALHDFDQRIQALSLLKESGYQVGTGVMIGLPFQNMEHLADDLIFFRDHSIDMIGMGPYIEHKDTPLAAFNNQLLSRQTRFDLSLRMIAILRIMMPDINIAAATALQAIDPIGREKAIKVGANIIMPNITPTENRGQYRLYEDKPCTDEGAEDCSNCLEARIHMAGSEVGFGEWGDSKHFISKQQQ